MTPSQIEPENGWTKLTVSDLASTDGLPRNLAAIDAIEFAESLKPKAYDILGTHPESKILFLDVNILDSTGNDPYRGDVLVEGKFP